MKKAAAPCQRLYRGYILFSASQKIFFFFQKRLTAPPICDILIGRGSDPFFIQIKKEVRAWTAVAVEVGYGIPISSKARRHCFARALLAWFICAHKSNVQSISNHMGSIVLSERVTSTQRRMAARMHDNGFFMPFFHARSASFRYSMHKKEVQTHEQDQQFDRHRSRASP